MLYIKQFPTIDVYTYIINSPNINALTAGKILNQPKTKQNKTKQKNEPTIRLLPDRSFNSEQNKAS